MDGENGDFFSQSSPFRHGKNREKMTNGKEPQKIVKDGNNTRIFDWDGALPQVLI